MTWTYTPDFTLTRDQIRIATGDTDSTDPMLSDEEIAQAYSEGGSVLEGAITACQWIIAKLSHEFDKNIDGLSTKRSQRHKAMLATLAGLVERRKDTSLAWSAPSDTSYTADTGEPGEYDGTAPPIYEPCDATRPQWEDPEA